MAWNPYQDYKNRAYSGVLTALFPEQTKTLPRILAWSVVFLADLTAVAAAWYAGLLPASTVVVLMVLLGLFWAQGKLWYGIAAWIARKREERNTFL